MKIDNQIARHLANDMNVGYVARVMGVPVERVELVKAKGVEAAAIAYPEPERVKRHRVVRKPVVRSAIKPMTGNEGVVELAERGLSASKIARRLKLKVTERQVSRYLRKKLGPSPAGANGAENAIRNLRPYIDECMRRLGKDPYFCEVCEERQERKCIIHHTKYDGATVYDLVYACTSCNNSRGNRGLL